MIPLAKFDDFGSIFFPVAGAVVAVIYLLVLIGKVREYFWPRTLAGKMRTFLGPLRGKLSVHDKSFPGYDLGSLNAALERFFKDDCASNTSLGMFHGELRGLVEKKPPQEARQIASLPEYRRLPIDVDQEESIVSNGVYTCTLPAAGQSPPEKVVLHLLAGGGHPAYDEDMDQHAAPAAMAMLSIACRDRSIAGRFFKDFDRRRRELSIYRGKVIDPVLHSGGIQSIAFRGIKRVGPGDLVLTPHVTDLIERSVVGFYRNANRLRQIGVDLKRGILFHGPPGTGKTSICLYLAGLLPHFTVCFVSGQRLLYPRELCRMARYLAPSILVFEDIDLIAQQRDQNGLATVLGELMNQIDGCEPGDEVLFIMNTNSLDRLESAVRNRPGRVDQIIHISVPDTAGRAQLLRHFARSLQVDELAIEATARATDGVTPALLKEVVKRGAVNAIERLSDAEILAISASDLLLAVEQVLAQREDGRPLGSRASEVVL